MVTPDEAVEGFIDALVDDDPAELYERAPCGYLSTLPDGTIVKANQTFLALSGWSREDMVGRHRFADLLSAGGRIYHETHYAPMLRLQGSVREIALDLVRHDGARLPVLVNSVLERDATGAPLIIRTAVFDATHRRENARELVREKERAEASEAKASALARTLQQTLIPPTPPTIPGLGVAGRYRPAGDGSEVGGDFYDIFQTGGSEWVITLGDVCGKGADAAVVTALVRYTVRAAAIQECSAQHVLATVNDVLLRQSIDRFCTLVLVFLRNVAGSWRASVSAAGHPLPLRRSPDGAVSPVGVPGSLLGVLDQPHVVESAVLLGPGDALLCYTDGMPEARSGEEFYGEDRLATMLSKAPDAAEAIVDALLEDVLVFQGSAARDDIALVAIRVPTPDELAEASAALRPAR